MVEVTRAHHGGAELLAGEKLCPGPPSPGASTSQNRSASQIPAVGYNLKGPRSSRTRNPRCQLAAGGQGG